MELWLFMRLYLDVYNEREMMLFCHGTKILEVCPADSTKKGIQSCSNYRD